MKYLNVAKQYGPKLALVSGGAFALNARAVGAYDSITSAVDFSTVATAIVAIFALLAVAAVAMKGGKWVLGAIGGGK